MSYQVLARKYRSKNFDQLVGQEHIARTLKKAIASDRIAHAFLFTGTRGTGKTSTARIFAKCLNCQSSKGPTTEPCDQCESCRAIGRGDDIDVIEIDAASNTQVDKTRDVIINNAQYSPAHSRFKIYIIDEVHMLSKSSFNALLKTLEEPPAHVKFILATTEAEKIPNTILSRCQRYDFRNIPTREIAEHLKDVTKQEKIKADEDALLLVAKAGAGSMRDALSLLDRLLSVGEKELTVELIEQMLGLPKSQLVFDLAQSIGEADVKEVLGRTDRMITGGLSPDTLLASLVDHLRNLLILRTCGPDTQLVEVPGLSMKDLSNQAARFDPIVLTQDIAVLEELRRQLRTSQAGRALLDATLVRLALAEQFNAIGNVLDATDRMETSSSPAPAPALKKKSDEAVAVERAREAVVESLAISRDSSTDSDAKSQATPRPEPAVAPAPIARATAAPAPVAPSDVAPATVAPAPLASPTVAPASGSSTDDDDDSLPAVGKVWDASGPSLSELLKQRSGLPPSPSAASPSARPAQAPVEPNIEPVALDELPALWNRMLDLLAARGAYLLAAVKCGRLASIEDDSAILRFDRKNDTFVKMLNGKKDLLRDLMTQAAGKPLGVRFEVEDVEPAAPTASSGASRGGTSGGTGGGVGGGGATAVMEAPARVEQQQPATQPAARRPEPARRAEPPPPPPMPAAPVANLIKVTPDVVEDLRNREPLIKGLMDELGAQIVKVEAPESVNA